MPLLGRLVEVDDSNVRRQHRVQRPVQVVRSVPPFGPEADDLARRMHAGVRAARADNSCFGPAQSKNRCFQLSLNGPHLVRAARGLQLKPEKVRAVISDGRPVVRQLVTW